MVRVKAASAGLPAADVWRPDLELRLPDSAPAMPVIHYAGAERLDPRWWRVDAHAHDHFELLVIQRGTQTTRFDHDGTHSETSCGEGSLLLLAPGISHTEWLEPDCSVEKLTLGFSWRGAGHRRLGHVAVDPSGRIRELASWIVHDLEAEPRQSERLSQLLLAALAEYERQAELPEHTLAARVRELFRASPGSPLGVERMARAAGMSRSVFAQRFREATQQTPMEYVRQLRLEYAHQLVATSDLPLKVIAADLGFASLQHFSRAVHQAFGVPPRDLRQRARAALHAADEISF
jgi:AraC-like DNA-binding protein